MVVETVDEELVAMENVTIEVYSLDDILITDTMTNENGNFLIQGIEGESYKLKIMVEDYNLYESEEIIVAVGEISDAGIIELVLTE